MIFAIFHRVQPLRIVHTKLGLPYEVREVGLQRQHQINLYSALAQLEALH